jgi:hypothetical protein
MVSIIRLTAERDIDFPKLMINKNGMIVLMLAKNGKGIRLDNKDGMIGDYSGFDESENWSIKDFSDFHGSITLSNQ